MTSGLLSMHKGRFHTDRSSTRDGEGASMERSKLITIKAKLLTVKEKTMEKRREATRRVSREW